MKKVLSLVSLFTFVTTHTYAGGGTIVLPVNCIPERTWSPIPEAPPSPRGPLVELRVNTMLGYFCRSTMPEAQFLSLCPLNRRRGTHTSSKERDVHCFFSARFQEEARPMFAGTLSFGMEANEVLEDIHARIQGTRTRPGNNEGIDILIQVEATRSRGGPSYKTTHWTFDPDGEWLSFP